MPAIDELRSPPSPDRVPTLTEVVELAEQLQGSGETPWPAPAPVAPDLPEAAALPEAPAEITQTLVEPWAAAPVLHEVVAEERFESPPAPVAPAPPAAPAMPAFDAQELVARTLQELAPHIEQMFQARLREALAPALARVADGLIRDARQELDTTLREMVREAVTRVQLRLHEGGSNRNSEGEGEGEGEGVSTGGGDANASPPH